MAVNSINSNVAAFFAQASIGNASQNVSSSVARLSSGNRIVRASDDVAGLSIGTSLRTNVSTLRIAKLNTSLGSSLLQVADGALAQIVEILQRQKALATQAGSGSLTSTERSFLNQEFTALTAEVDRIASTTNFNGVSLLDGALSEAASIVDSTAQATKGSLTLSFSNTISLKETVQIGGVTLLAGASASGTTFEVGASISETVENLAARLNALAETSTYNNTLGDAVYSAQGQNLIITSRTGGALSNNFTTETNYTVSLAANAVATTNSSSAVVVTVGSGHNFVVGQEVHVSGATASLSNITVSEFSNTFTITAVGTNTITFTTNGTANATANVGNAGISITANSASFSTEANVDGGFSKSYFNLFATTTGLSSATTVVSADADAASTPFQNGDSITAKINGVTKTLYTFGSASDGGAYTLKDIVDGINANEDSTGIGASLVYSSGTYNIRLEFDGQASNVIVNAGTNYNSTTYGLNGATISSADIVDGDASTARNQAVFYTGYVDLLASDIGSVTSTATVIGTTATAPFVIGDNITISINGEQQILHTFASGDGFDDIVASINAKTASTGVYAAITGTAADVSNIRLFVTEPGAGGTNLISVTTGTPADTAGDASAATETTTTGAAVNHVTTYGLDGGADDGLGLDSVKVTGAIGDSVLTALGTSRAEVSLILTQNATATETLTVGGQTFTFTSNTTAAPNEILIGSSISETLDNAISTISEYLSEGYALGTTAYELNQINITRDGNTLVFTGNGLENVTTLTGGTSSVATSVTGASLTNSGNLSNASTTYGVDVTGISNPEFTGTLNGFSATYKSTDTVDLSIVIGDYTYTASNVDVTVASNTRVRLFSDTLGDGSSGGYFDIQLQAGQISAVTNQTQATTVANRLDAAFSSLTFLQERDITSYNGTQTIVSDSTVIGSLVGTSVSAQFDSFDAIQITDISVTAPSGSNTDASITLTIGGVQYSTQADLGSELGANQTFTLVSADDPNQFVKFTTGDSAITIDSVAKASAVQQALKDAFGINEDAAALSFQVGGTTADSLQVSISSVTTSSIFGGQTLDVLTQSNAQNASDTIDDAIRAVTAVRADVGGLQSRFNFAAANIDSSIQNQDAARGELLDTDIASESTAFSISQVKLQAGISTLAQANQQLQSLLKLIG